MSKLQKHSKWKMDKFTDDGDVKWDIHKADVCQGPCPFHSPSDHHMKDWPIHMRLDPFKYGEPERHCEHNIGHPDPDSVAFHAQHGAHGMGVHGCDGCCKAE